MLDFIQRRTRAVKTTFRFNLLVVLAQFATATLTGLVIGYLMMLGIVLAISSERPSDQPLISGETTLDPWLIFFFTSSLSICAVGAGIVIVTWVERRHIQKDGGWSINAAADGRLIEKPQNSDERKLVNVVEELAIAFGTRPPAILVLDGEPGINVFAAGLTEQDRILCVTSGAMMHLIREELQGVVAHEYSHLMYGDTALGTRLTASLHGLNSIRLASEALFSCGIQITKTNTKQAGNGYLMMAVAAIVWPFGVAGVIAAALVTLAMTRTQELLADAEAVEKTRNPRALASALRRIKGHPQQGRLRNSKISIVAPMLFVDCRSGSSWFSTHPSLASRILALDPAGPQSAIYPRASGQASDRSASPKTAEALQLVFANALVNMGCDEDIPVEAPSPENFAEAVLVILSVVCGIDGEDTITDYEFLRGWNQFRFADASRIPVADLDEHHFEWALGIVSRGTPPDRQNLLVALANAISGDGRTSPEELEIVGIVRDAINRDSVLTT